MPENDPHIVRTAQEPRLGLPGEDLGEYLVSCRRGWAVRIVQSLLVLMFASLGGLMVYLSIAALPRGGWQNVSFLLVIAAVCGLIAWFFTLHIYVTMDFYENGMVWRSLLRRGVVRFQAATRLDYNVIRSYSHGIYTGSVVTFAVYPAEGRRFRWTGGYKEKPRGTAFTIFGSTFESDDPMDIAREAMSIHVADTLTRLIDEGKEVEWSKEAVIDAAGVVPRGMLGRQERIPWSDIRGMGFDRNTCLVETSWSKKAAVTVQCNGRNFWPGMRVVKRRTEK